MRGYAVLVCAAAAAALWSGADLLAQRVVSTRLMVRVEPGAYLTPAEIPLRFVVPDGAGDAAGQTATLFAWVRSAPGQQIHVTARIGEVRGPSGPVESRAIGWDASVARATAGGQSAACVNGSFASGETQELVSGWSQSGTLTCALAFAPREGSALAPGVYTGTVRLALQAR